MFIESKFGHSTYCLSFISYRVWMLPPNADYLLVVIICCCFQYIIALQLWYPSHVFLYKSFLSQICMQVIKMHVCICALFLCSSSFMFSLKALQNT